MRAGNTLIAVAVLAVFVSSSGACAAAGQAETPLFRFAHISDTHCMFTNDLDKAHNFGGRIYSRSFDIFKGALGYLEDDVRPAFLIHTGDIVENGGWESGLATMQKATDMVSGKSFVFLPVFGNHDVSADRFEQVFGPDNYTFTYGSTLFVVLRCLNDFPVLGRRSQHIPKSILYQLDDLLTRWTGNVIVCVHEPLRCHEDEAHWALVANHDLVTRILERHGNVAMVLQGHTHFFYRERANGIEYVTAPGLVNMNKQEGDELGHPMLVYDVYADRIECRMHGAQTTDAAVTGSFQASKTIDFTVPLSHKAALRGNDREGLRPRRLPLTLARYDAEIEGGFNPIAFYLFDGWQFRTDAENQGLPRGWHTNLLDAGEWKRVKRVYLQHPWEVYLAPGYDGYAWYRITFTVAEGLRDMDLQVVLGKIDGSDETYLNGILVGRTGELPPSENKVNTAALSRTYALPDAALRYGKENTLGVRVFDAGGSGGMLGLPYVRINRQTKEFP